MTHGREERRNIKEWRRRKHGEECGVIFEKEKIIIKGGKGGIWEKEREEET